MAAGFLVVFYSQVRFGTSCGFILSEACQIFFQEMICLEQFSPAMRFAGQTFSTVHDAKFAINKESLNFNELTNWLAVVDWVSCRIPVFYFCWCICSIQSNFFSQIGRLSFPIK